MDDAITNRLTVFGDQLTRKGRSNIAELIEPKLKHGVEFCTTGWQPDVTEMLDAEHFSGFCPRHQRIDTRKQLTRSR